jgi:D-lactate dehydrogenase (cytochrome)
MKNAAILASRLADQFGARQITSPSALAPYAQSEGPHRHAAPELVLQPVSVEEVQLAVRNAAEMQLPIVAYGAGTSLEGNAAAISPGTVCIDFSRMDRIIDVRAGDLVATVEPGVTREALNHELRASGLFFPVDPGANASLGGMIATRASGTNTVRYGSMRDNVLALKVVTANGGLISTGTKARKSASGYDLTHLFAACACTVSPKRSSPRPGTLHRSMVRSKR